MGGWVPGDGTGHLPPSLLACSLAIPPRQGGDLLTLAFLLLLRGVNKLGGGKSRPSTLWKGRIEEGGDAADLVCLDGRLLLPVLLLLLLALSPVLLILLLLLL